MQTICTSLQTDNHIKASSANFYRPDALPDAQPTVSKHWRHIKSRAKYTDIAVRNVTLPNHWGNSDAIWDHTVLHATRQSWHSRLHPAEVGTRFSDPERTQGWADLGTAVKVRSPCPRLHITVAFAISTAIHDEIQTWVLSHRSWTCQSLDLCNTPA